MASTRLLARVILFSLIAAILLIALVYQARTKPNEPLEPSGTRRIEVGLGPVVVAVDPKLDRAVVANSVSNDVSVVDLASGKSFTIDVGKGPGDVALRPAPTPNDSNLALVPTSGDNLLWVLDLDNQEVAYRLEVGQAPVGVALNPRTGRAVVTNSGSNTVSIVDLGEGKVVDEIDVGKNPRGVTIDTASNRAFVADRGSNDISVIDLSTNQIIRTIAVETEPEAIAINPEAGPSGIAVVTTRTAAGQGQLTVINLQNFAITAQIDVQAEPLGVAIHPVTNVAVVRNYGSNTVSLVDVTAGRVTSTVPVGRAPFGTAVHPDLNLGLVVNSGPEGAERGILELIQLAYPIPAIQGFSPGTLVVGSPEARLTINGSRFFRTSSVRFDGGAIETSFISSRQLAVRIPASLLTVARRAPVVVGNPAPGGGT
jgi:YVTN family beta-propeller protein